MSDFWSIYNDAAYDQYLNELLIEQEYEITKLQQCIYLLVEGVTEEKAYPELLAKCDLMIEDVGVTISNYGGANNLIHILRLLKKTLSHDRPVIATIDNDYEGSRIVKKLTESDFADKLLTLVPIPCSCPKVIYPNGHKGGSFEELFEQNFFVDQVFNTDFMPVEIFRAKEGFLGQFEPEKPWFNQVKRFCAERNYCDFEKHKVDIGIKLSERCKKVPPDIMKLSEIIREVRQKHPVRHVTEIASEQLKNSVEEDSS